MRSRLVELRRARWVALGALAVGLGGAFAPAIAQDAELGLRGAAERSPTPPRRSTQAAPIQTPDAATAVADDRAAGRRRNRREHEDQAGQGRCDQAAAAEALSAARNGWACAAARPTRKPSRSARRPSPPSRLRSGASPPPDDKPFDPVGFSVGDLKLTPYVEEDGGWASNPGLSPGPQSGSAFETTEVGRRAAIRLVAQRSARPAEGRLHRLFRRPQRQFADRERHARRALRRQPRPVVRRRGPFQRQRADADLARPRLGNGRRPRIRWSRPTARRSAARRSSAT